MAGVFFRIGSLSAQAFTANFVLLLLAVFVASASTNQGTWTNPCSKATIRQVRSTAEKELKFLINILNKQLFHDLKIIYSKDEIDTSRSKGNCPRINKIINNIKTEQNITVAYKKFHKAMLEMSSFLDQLMNMSIVSNVKFSLEKRENRQAIYLKTQNALRLAICEFNETIMHEYKVIPYSITASSKRSNCLPKETDFTHLGMLDIQFFTKLKRLFKAGRVALKKLKLKSRSKSSKVKNGQNRHLGSNRKHTNGRPIKKHTAPLQKTF